MQTWSQRPKHTEQGLCALLLKIARAPFRPSIVTTNTAPCTHSPYHFASRNKTATSRKSSGSYQSHISGGC
jgi:hypothetical protein